jgi:hypothetical protein
MARRKNQPDAVRAKFELAERLRAIRTELYGERGGPELARRLNVPVRTWYNYESGVTVPSELMLRFVDLTSVEPGWLLKGTGPRYRTLPPLPESGGSEPSVQALLRTALEYLERRRSQTRSPTPVAEGKRQAAGRTQAADPPGEESDAPSEPRMPTLASAVADADWQTAHPDAGYVRSEGNAMVPVVGDGAFVAYAHDEEDLGSLEGCLVVAWLQGRAIVRWFERSGPYGVLRAENPNFEPAMTLIDLDAPPDEHRMRRVLWIGTPH